MKTLVVVESPAKARTIGKYLGSDYKVVASFGHIRELPRQSGSIDTANSFKITYIIGKNAQKHVAELVSATKTCERLLLASDPDREGEAIAWHVVEVLRQKKAITAKTQVQRIVFNAITRDVVVEALKKPRALDMNLINAQQARVALDYLVGFSLSPVLWRKLPGSRSAGRVQSVALRLICERQLEIMDFKSQEYWTVDVELATAAQGKLQTHLVEVDGQKLQKLSITSETAAKKLEAELVQENYRVSNLEQKKIKRHPFPPFTTSTLQQDASHKLGFSAKKTMSLAQKLYEGVDMNTYSHGLITYMRTDGTYVTPEALAEARQFIQHKYGEKYLPPKARVYKNKIKNAQEAHEAIRPTDPQLAPENLRSHLTADEYALYDIIWRRFIASQMQEAILDQTLVDIKTSRHLLHASGSILKFKGFLILYNETSENENGSTTPSLLPQFQKDETLIFKKTIVQQHFTEPPPRYTEASLVKKMEELGIGRPSTYATIMSVLQDRKYVRLEKKCFFAENRGFIVDAFLKIYFAKYVAYDYTAKLENDLDSVANGRQEWTKLLDNFWPPFKKDVDYTLSLKNSCVLEQLTSPLNRIIFGSETGGQLQNKCPSCQDGLLGIKFGKFGTFVACKNYPNCKYIKRVFDSDTNISEAIDEKLIGVQEEENIYLRHGPYGFYLQAGDITKTSKPKRVKLPTNINPSDVDITKAAFLLSLPKILGHHPDDGQPLQLHIGPYGPYLSWNKKFYHVPQNVELFNLDMTKALTLLKTPKKSFGGKKTQKLKNRRKSNK